MQLLQLIINRMKWNEIRCFFALLYIVELIYKLVIYKMTRSDRTHSNTTTYLWNNIFMTTTDLYLWPALSLVYINWFLLGYRIEWNIYVEWDPSPLHFLFPVFYPVLSSHSISWRPHSRIWAARCLLAPANKYFIRKLHPGLQLPNLKVLMESL